MNYLLKLLLSLSIILLFIGNTVAADLTFDENGEFKILIVADTQDTDRPQEAMLNLLEASLNESNPDMVVFLGDQIYGISLGEIDDSDSEILWKAHKAIIQNPTDEEPLKFFGNIISRSIVDDESSVKDAIDKIIAPVEKRNIPFAFVFGNHDDQNTLSKEHQFLYYKSHDNCLAWDYPEISGVGNYYLLINNSEGKPVFNLWFFDSGNYAPEGLGKYAWVQEDQIEWYKNTSNELTAENGKIPSFVFQHIIVPEAYEMLTEVPKDTENTVKGSSGHEDSYYIANPEYISSGSVKEGPAPPEYNSGEFSAWKNQGDVIAAFFGHDHNNDFVGTYQGIDLVATPGCGFFIYGNKEYHGTRVVTLYEDDLKNYSTELLYYKDIVDEPLPIWLIPVYGAFVQAIVLTALSFFLAIPVFVTLIVVLIKHRKRR